MGSWRCRWWIYLLYRSSAPEFLVLSKVCSGLGLRSGWTESVPLTVSGQGAELPEATSLKGPAASVSQEAVGREADQATDSAQRCAPALGHLTLQVQVGMDSAHLLFPRPGKRALGLAADVSQGRPAPSSGGHGGLCSLLASVKM